MSPVKYRFYYTNYTLKPFAVLAINLDLEV